MRYSDPHRIPNMQAPEAPIQSILIVGLSGKKWRREGDLNPRNPYQVDGLAIRCITALPSLRIWDRLDRSAQREIAGWRGACQCDMGCDLQSLCHISRAPPFSAGLASGCRRPVGMAESGLAQSRNRPDPGWAHRVAFSMTTRPRLNTVSGQPVRCRPS